MGGGKGVVVWPVYTHVTPPLYTHTHTHTRKLYLLHPLHLRDHHDIARLEPVAVLLQHRHHAGVGLVVWAVDS